MKNTMKKLLCMALAIMLLVSAVPVFAAASSAGLMEPGNLNVEIENPSLTSLPEAGVVSRPETPQVDPPASADPAAPGASTYTVSGNATVNATLKEITSEGLFATISTATKQDVASSVTLKALLVELFGSQHDAYALSVDINGTRTALESQTLADCTANNGAVNITFYRQRCEYTVYLQIQGSSQATVSFKVPYGTTLNIADEFAKRGLTPDADKHFEAFLVDNVPKTSVTIAKDTTIVAKQAMGAGTGTGTGTGSGTGSGTGTGNVTKFKVTFLNVNGLVFYTEDVAANGTIAASADFLNTSVGTRDGYEHIGWKASNGSTKTTSVVLTDRINSNVTYSPIFRNANGGTWIPTTGSGNVSSGSGTTTNKFPYPVYLNIYKDTLVGSPDKRVEITNGIALDGLVSLEEAKTVVKNYYTAKDSDGISYDGLYIAEGNWVANYGADTQKYDSINAGEMRQTGTVYINVMIGNAKAKTTATADSSNPKTGDTIFVPFMVMGVTATALAAAYIFGKKRIAR